jgi:hypothetical protein
VNLIVCISVFIFGLILLAFNAIRFSFVQNKNKQIRTLTLYLIASTIEGIFCFSLFFIFSNENFFISHIFFNVQLLFLGLFYYNLFNTKKEKRYVKYASIIVFTISVLQYIIKPASFWQFSLLEIISVSVVLISYALMHLYNTMGENKNFFYFSIGVIMYFLCSCIIYLTGGLTLVFCQDPYIDHWIIKDIFFIVYQLLIIKEYSILKKQIHA